MKSVIEGRESVQGVNIYRDPDTETWRYNPKRKRNRILAEEAYLQKNPVDFPLHLIIEPTNNCNMTCQMCLRDAMTRPLGYMEWGTFRKIVDECAANNTYSFSLYMLGEPMLHPRIKEMVNYAKKMGIPYVDISTNALIDMKHLLGTALNELIISLDGIDNATYNKNRQGKYLLIEKNISDLLEAKKKGNYEYPLIRLQIIDMKSTKPYLEQFINKWRDKADVVYIKKLEAMVQTLGNKLITEEDAIKRQKDRRPCKLLFFTHNINWNGDHAICCNDPYGKTVIGNIEDISIKEAWQGALKREEIKRQIKGIYKGLCEKCIDWENW